MISEKAHEEKQILEEIHYQYRQKTLFRLENTLFC